MSPKKPEPDKYKARYSAKVYGLTRYKDQIIADLVHEAAEDEGMSIASLQRKAVYSWLENHPRLGPRFREALKQGRKSKGLLARIRAGTKRESS
ncbi:MAG: hypothetical protein V1495_00365 [Pseudomonadota bacterium]